MNKACLALGEKQGILQISQCNLIYFIDVAYWKIKKNLTKNPKIRKPIAISLTYISNAKLIHSKSFI